MDITIFTTAAQLGGTVFVVVTFLWYLSKRDRELNVSIDKNADNNVVLAKALQKLTDVIERNSSANATNTSKIAENITAVKDNTQVTDKNTAEVKLNGRH